ncbi:MAG: YIP1 family protein [Thaumarchaeota archaeon]|nr:YIP1 family protein [Nitrososphaerota archaeon]
MIDISIERKLYCPSCGASNADDAAFCKSCGAKLSDSAPAAVSASSPVASQGGSPKMRIMGVFKTAIAIVKNPVGYMKENRSAVPLKSLMINYVAVLATIPFFATLLGDLWYYAHDGKYASAIPAAIFAYILELVAIFVLGIVIWKVGPSFGTKVSQDMATTLAAYVYTPVFLISIVYLIPPISLLVIVGLLYGLYIFYKGVPILLNTPQDKVLVYVIVVLVVALVIGFVFSALAGIATTALFRV